MFVPFCPLQFVTITYIHERSVALLLSLQSQKAVYKIVTCLYILQYRKCDIKDYIIKYMNSGLSMYITFAPLV